MSRRFTATRFSEINTAPQCVACNMFRGGEQYKFGQFIDDLYGEGAAKNLQRIAHSYHKYTREELIQIITDSKTEVSFYLEKGK